MALLHVTNGDSTAGTLAQTSLGGDVLAWRDVLHAGPVCAGPRDSLLRARATFLADNGWGSAGSLLRSLEERDTRYLEALRGGDGVALWFEHDLYDQLQLLDALTVARDAGARPQLIVVGSFPGRPTFRGLGELTPEELESLWPSRVRADAALLDAAAAAWDALRSPAPTALAALARRAQPELPFLTAALRRLLAELPAPGDGLSATERHALRAIAAGASTPAAAFLAAQDFEHAPFLGDTWFFRELSILSSGERPLVRNGDGRGLELTDEGQDVLAGRRDRLELVPLDRWVGGTHVTGDSVWRWDPDAGELQR